MGENLTWEAGAMEREVGDIPLMFFVRVAAALGL